jgi:hypothetical protein
MFPSLGIIFIERGKQLWFVVVLLGAQKSPNVFTLGLKEYGSYLLSRIVVQYHWPWGA